MKYFCKILIVGTIASMLVGEELSAATPASQHGGSAERVSQSADVAQKKSDPNRRQSEQVQKPVPFDQIPKNEREAAYLLTEKSFDDLQVWANLYRLANNEDDTKAIKGGIRNEEVQTMQILRQIIKGTDWLEELARKNVDAKDAASLLSQFADSETDTNANALVTRAKRVLGQGRLTT